MLGSGEISEHASVASLLAANAGSNFGDLQNGGRILYKYPMSMAERILEWVAICSLDRARHAWSSDLAASLIHSTTRYFSCLNSLQGSLPLQSCLMFPGSRSKIRIPFEVYVCHGHDVSPIEALRSP